MKHIKPYKRLKVGDYVILKDKPNNIFIVTNTKDAQYSNYFYWVNITDINNPNSNLEVISTSLKLAKKYKVTASKYNL